MPSPRSASAKSIRPSGRRRAGWCASLAPGSWACDWRPCPAWRRRARSTRPSRRDSRRAAARACGRCRGRGRARPGQRAAGQRGPAGGSGGLDPATDLGRRGGHAGGPRTDLAVVLAGATRVGDADARHLPGSGRSGRGRRPDGRHPAGLAASVDRDRGCRLVRRPGHRAGRSIDGRRAADRRRLTNGGPGIRGVGGRPGGHAGGSPAGRSVCVRPRTADATRWSPALASVGASWLVLFGVFGAVA